MVAIPLSFSPTTIWTKLIPGWHNRKCSLGQVGPGQLYDRYKSSLCFWDIRHLRVDPRRLTVEKSSIGPRQGIERRRLHGECRSSSLGHPVVPARRRRRQGPEEERDRVRLQR